MVYTLNESTGKTRPQKTYATARTRVRGQYGWHTQTPTQRANTIRDIRARKAEMDAKENKLNYQKLLKLNPELADFKREFDLQV